MLEICICVAIRLPDGRLFRGNRPGDCFASAYSTGWEPTSGWDAGFITSTGRFVRPAEAFAIQLAAGVKSASPDGYRGSTLFSEDLY